MEEIRRMKMKMIKGKVEDIRGVSSTSKVIKRRGGQEGRGGARGR